MYLIFFTLGVETTPIGISSNKIRFSWWHQQYPPASEIKGLRKYWKTTHFHTLSMGKWMVLLRAFDWKFNLKYRSKVCDRKIWFSCVKRRSTGCEVVFSPCLARMGIVCVIIKNKFCCPFSVRRPLLSFYL